MEDTFVGALALAFLGGLVINFMPCVLPVLSLKILSIVRQSAAGRTAAVADGMLYTAGVSSSILLLSVVLLVLRGTAGHLLGWGFQMQSPVLVTGLLHITFLVGVSFAGGFDIDLGLSPQGTATSGKWGGFFSGVLAALMGTPCAAPFMVSAISFAMMQPGWFRAMAIFQSVGLGMSFPYLVLTCFPGVGCMFPKPGQWMEYLKQFLAFPMYATSAWLLHVLVSQKGVSILFPAVLSIIVVALVVWLFRALVDAAVLSSTKGLVLALLLYVVSVSTYVGHFHGGDVTVVKQRTSVEFSKEKLATLLGRGETVFLAVGAEWCLTCQVNEVVIASKSVQNLLREHGVVYMKADWTNADQAIAEYLSEHGNSVPFYALYVRGKLAGPIPQVFSERALLEILNKHLGSAGP
ncbi:MAG: protein-disulfide reductase DsbD family protein [Anaplasma sp.]